MDGAALKRPRSSTSARTSPGALRRRPALPVRRDSAARPWQARAKARGTFPLDQVLQSPVLAPVEKRRIPTTNSSVITLSLDELLSGREVADLGDDHRARTREEIGHTSRRAAP